MKLLDFLYKNTRIHVVDDSDMNLIVYKSLLKSCGLEIDTAQSGKECLELVKEQTYDIVFMDHMVPEMDGMETFREMKNLGDYRNEEFYLEMLKKYITPAKKEELQKAYQEKDWKFYVIKIHALKGNAKTLGLENLSEIAEELQKAGEKEDIGYIEENHGKAMALLDTLSDVVKKL